VTKAIAVMTDDNFVQHYHGRRRRVYDKACRSLEHTQVCKSDADCKVFLKKEKDIASDKPDAVPRVITFPDPRFGMSFGKFIKAIELDFFNCIDHCFGSKTVMKGLNYDTLGKEIQRKWYRYRDPCSIDGDVSRLDSSISDEAQRLYHSFASTFFYGFELEQFRKLCEMQLNVKVRGKTHDGNVSYKSTGLGSGQMNTSQVGVFIVCLILWHIKEENKLDLEVVNCGDDFSVIGERRTVKQFGRIAKQYFSKFNMILKLEPLNDIIERLNFCQTNPVFVNGSYRMVRNPRNAVIKDATSIDYLNSTTNRTSYLHAISCSGISTHGGIPILQEVYKMYAENAQEIRTTIKSRRGVKRSYKTNLRDHSMLYWGKGMRCSYTKITNETRYSFFLAFDIDPIQQIYIEKYYKNLKIDDHSLMFKNSDQCLW